MTTTAWDPPAKTPSPPSSEGTYDYQKLHDLWTSNGGDPTVAPLMAHVALSESSGNPNSTGKPYVENGKTYHAHGLWQISDVHGNENWNDPVTNVKKAIELYKAVKMAPWEATRSKWQQYVNQGASGNVQPWDTTQSTSKVEPWDTPAHSPAKPGATAPTGKADHTLPGAMPKPLSVAAHAFNIANAFVTEAGGRMKESAADPLGAAINLEQTPQRAIHTLIAHGVSGPTVGAAFFNAFNPGANDEDTNRILSAISAKVRPLVHVATEPLRAAAKVTDSTKDDFTKQYDAWLKTPAGHKEAQVESNAPIGPTHIENFLTSYISGSLADPVSYFPAVSWLRNTAAVSRGLNTVAEGARLVGGTKAAAPFVRSANAVNHIYGKVIQHTAAPLFGTRPELSKNLEEHAKAARIGFEHAHIADVSPIRTGDTELLQRHNKALNQFDADMTPKHREDFYSRTPGLAADVLSGGLRGEFSQKLQRLLYNVPDEVSTRVLTGMYKFGDPETRLIARRFGYKPTAEDLPVDSPAKGELSLKDYDKIISRKVGPGLLQEFFHTVTPELFPHGNTPSLGKLVGSYLFGESNALWQARADRATKSYLEQHGGWKGPGPIDISKLSHGPNEGFHRWEAKVFGEHGSPAKVLGRWGTQAVQGVPFAHAINNVGTLTYLKSPIGLGRAIGYMSKGEHGVSEAQLTRLKRMGSFAEYTTDPGTIWTKMPGIGHALKGGQKVLSTMEISYRQGLLDELDRTLGPSIDEHGNVTNLRLEMQKGQEIRDAVVDYRNVPLVIAWMQSAGAPFAPFLGGLVKAVGQAAIRNPERVANVMRAERDEQEEFGQTIPNPVNTAAGLAFDAPHTIANHLGLLGSPYTKEGESAYPSSLLDYASVFARSAGGPVVSRGPSFFNEPYHAPGTTGPQFTPVEGLLNLLLGEYPYRPQSAKAIKTRERDIYRSIEEARSALPEH